MNKLIDLVSLKKVYRNGAEKVHAVDDVSFTVVERDYISIVGPSGSGKSTLLHIMGGLERPTSGKVFFKGKDIYAMDESERAVWRAKNAGFIFQFYHLIDELTVFENIAVAAGSLSIKYPFKSTMELLEYLMMEKRRNFYPFQLSGGEKQKTAIARALINDPSLILCDEPTGNLDRGSQERVAALLESLNKELGKTIILVTHNQEIARRADKTFCIKEGKIVSQERHQSVPLG